MKRFNHRGHRGTQRNTTVGSTEVTGTGGNQNSELRFQIEKLGANRRLQSAIYNEICNSYQAGFHRRTGFLAAVVSSRRDTRVECGASSTVCVSSSTSRAIDFMASTNRSISSFDSLSVGSIIRAPGTISGKAV